VDKRVKSIIGIIAAIIFTTSLAFADSCPYCGQEYPDECAPGDEGYIASIREAHEAECGRTYERQQSSTSRGGHDASYQRQLEQQRIRQQQQEVLRRQREERMRRQKEEKARRLEEERKRKVEFQKNKNELVSSLKGDSAGGLKGVGTSSGLQLKGLKIREVPLPSSVKKPGLPLKLKGTGSREAKTGEKKKNIIVQALIKSYEKTKEDFIAWTKTSTFEMTFGSVPGASYAKALYDKYKNMRDEMESLNVNILEYAMSGMQKGIGRSASEDLSDGGLSNEYEEGRGGLFGRTSKKARELLKKEVDSKSK